MKTTQKRTLLIMAGIALPPLFIGYVNWDITTVTRISEWSEDGRIMYGSFTFMSILVSIGLAFIAIEDKL